LRPPRLDDEEQFAAAQRALAEEGFAFCFNSATDVSWARYVERLDCQRRGEALPAGWVPTTFLVADVAGCIVGRASIRHEERVLVTCDDNNAGPAAVIERCGGVFDSMTMAGDGKAVRRYWID